MSFLSSTSNYLSAKLDIHFEQSGVVDMVGGANTGSSYSLPGHVIINIPSLPASIEHRVREVRELSLAVEGKSEFYDERGRYTPMRLWSTTVTLATPDNPLLLPSDPSTTGKVQVAFPFDLRIPGWLPPSHESALTLTAYGAISHAVLGWAEDPIPYSASCGVAIPVLGESSRRAVAMPTDVEMRFDRSFRPRQSRTRSHLDSFFSTYAYSPQPRWTATERATSKYKEFLIRRHRLPGGIGRPTPTIKHFTVKPEKGTNIPIECVVSLPDWVDVNDERKNVDITLRVRGKRTAALGVDEEAGGKEDEMLTYMMELGMEVEETERFHSVAHPSYAATFPIAADQPRRNSSEHALLSARSTWAESGFLSNDQTPFRGFRTRSCLLADDGCQRNFYFAGDGLGLGDLWRKVNVVLPIPDATETQMANRPQPECEGPFLRIRHALKIRIVCQNAGTAPADRQAVVLTVPVRFGTSPNTCPTPSPRELPILPAYIQLFHENGELRQCDPLPLYTRHVDQDVTPPNATPSASLQVPKPAETMDQYCSPSPGPSCAEPDFPSRAPSPADSRDEQMDLDPPSDEAGSTSLYTGPRSDRESERENEHESISGSSSGARERDTRSAAPPPTTPTRVGGRKMTLTSALVSRLVA